MSAEDLEKYETEMELQLYREYRDVVGLFSLRRRDRAPVLPHQPRRPAGAQHRGRRGLLRGDDGRRLGLGHVPPGAVRQERARVTFKDVNVEELAQERSRAAGGVPASAADGRPQAAHHRRPSTASSHSRRPRGGRARPGSAPARLVRRRWSGAGQGRGRVRYGEEVAAAHLSRGRMAVLDRNWRCAARRDRHRRARRRRAGRLRGEDPAGDGFGHPLEAVTARKAARLRRLAAAWLAASTTVHPAEVRIDVVGVLRPRAAPAEVEHVGGWPECRWPGPAAVALVGVDGHLVEVEADLGVGVPAYSLVGPAGRVAGRVARPGARGGGQQRPALAGDRRVTVNLSPASLPKRGSGFDLAIAAAMLAGAGGGARARVRGAVLLGELGLDGRVRPVRGVLPAVAAAARAGVDGRGRAGGERGRGARWCRACGSTGVRIPGRRWSRGRAATSCRTAELADEPPAVDADDEATRRTGRTSPTSSARPPPATCSRWPRPAATTCSWPGRRGPGKTMLAERLPGLLPAAGPGGRARGHRGPLGGRVAARRRRAAGDAPAVPGAAPHRVGGRDRRRRLRPRPARARRRWPTAACCSSTRRRSSRPACSTRCASRWSPARSPSPGWRRGAVPGAVPAGAGGQPVPVRAGRDRAGPAHGCTCTPMARLRYLGRLSGPLLDRVDLRIEVPPRRARTCAAARRRRRARRSSPRGCRRAGADGRPAGRHAVAGQRRGARATSCAGCGGCRGRSSPRPSGCSTAAR